MAQGAKRRDRRRYDSFSQTISSGIIIDRLAFACGQRPTGASEAALTRQRDSMKNPPSCNDSSRKRNQGLIASGHRCVEPGGADCPRGFPRLQLPRNPHADSRRRRSFSRAASARKPTSFRRRCTPSKIATALGSSLRPENTASVIRAYIEHRLDQRPGVQKLYYIGPMFRRERPQKGRYRQFFQIGAEAIGSESPFVDAEVIEMVVGDSHARGTQRLHPADQFRGLPELPPAVSSKSCARR